MARIGGTFTADQQFDPFTRRNVRTKLLDPALVIKLTDFSFRFIGKINKLTVKLGPEQLAPADKEKLQNTLREHD